jgi:DNA-binding HxlR family transcriptional regulator
MLRSLDANRCPVEQALEVVGGKWKPLILWRLASGTLRFGQLQRSMPGVTQRMLTLQLRELERDGLLQRTVHAEVPPRVEYTLTEPARGLLPVMQAMGQWLLTHHSELEARSSNMGEPRATPARGTTTVRGGNVRSFRIAK